MPLNVLVETPPEDWPAEAGQIIRGFLDDKSVDFSARLLAAELAADQVVMDETMVRVLLEVLKNTGETEQMRSQAAISLGTALENENLESYEFIEYLSFEGADQLQPNRLPEKVVQNLQSELRRLFTDAKVPNEVRRYILESSVRSPQSWHQDAVRAAYASGDNDWMLTAVFCMNFIKGFDQQILESLESEDPDIFYEAVCAAGNMGIEKAWPFIATILDAAQPDKDLLLAAIDAVPALRPEKALDVIGKYLNHKDRDIVEAVFEALSMADAILEFDNLLDMEDGLFDDDE